ncbi:hypothetical protein, partial [Anaerotruncus colihominis]
SHPLFFFYKYLRQVCLFVILADHLHAARLLDHYVYRGEDRALSFYDMSAKMYQQAQQSAPDGQAAPQDNGSAGGDGYVDADFREVDEDDKK